MVSPAVVYGLDLSLTKVEGYRCFLIPAGTLVHHSRGLDQNVHLLIEWQVFVRDIR